MWLAWPPANYTAPLLLMAFVPLLLATEDIIQSESARKGKRIFRLAFLTFFVWNTSCIYWVFNALHAVMPAWTAVLISLIPFGLAAVLMTVSFWLYYQMRKISSKKLSYLGLVVFWVAYEYLHQTWDLAFPWMTLGNGFAASHQLIQWYEYTGVYGGTVWIWVANILAFELFMANRHGGAVKSLAPGLMLWITVPIFLSFTIYSRYTEKENPANIVVVQPNIDPYMKFGELPASEQLRRLIHLSDSVAQPNTEYFIWPETAIPDYTDEADIRGNSNYLQVLSFLSRYRNGNVLSGIESYLRYDEQKTSTARYNSQDAKYYDAFNAAVQIENSARVQFYHKSKLVPGVEQTPFSSALSFMKPVFAEFGGTTGGYGFQEDPTVFYAQSGMGVAPVICYESIWGEYVADAARKGAQFIAVITNDGWWGNTAGKDQHLDYAKLRAIETRKWVARSANTGISAFINQRGDIVRQSKWWEATALKADINLNDELTFYVKTGDYIAKFASVAAVFLLLFLLVKTFRIRQTKS